VSALKTDVPETRFGNMVENIPPRRRSSDPRVTYAKRSLPFAESGAGKYTHRVRSVQIIALDPKQWPAHIAVSCWCGQSVLISEKRQHKASRIVAEPSRVLCATCEGRAIGAGQLGAQEIGGRAVMFSPQRGER